MRDQASIEFLNLDDWLRELNTLPDVIRKGVATGAVATAASVIRREIVQRAPVWTGSVSKGHPPPGTLKRSIYQTRLVDECTRDLEVFLIGVRQGRRVIQRGRMKGTRTNDRDAYYARWVEYGHYSRTPKGLAPTKAARRAIVASGSQLVVGAKWIMPRPFFRPGFEAKKGAALMAMRDYLAKRIPVAVAATRYWKAISQG